MGLCYRQRLRLPVTLTHFEQVGGFFYLFKDVMSLEVTIDHSINYNGRYIYLFLFCTLEYINSCDWWFGKDVKRIGIILLSLCQSNCLMDHGRPWENLTRIVGVSAEIRRERHPNARQNCCHVNHLARYDSFEPQSRECDTIVTSLNIHPQSMMW
jgi:hypothetical protein